MSDTERLVRQIVSEAGRSPDFAFDHDSSILGRYRGFVLKYLETHKSDRTLQVRQILSILEAILIAVGAALGFFVLYSGADDGLKLTVWILYVVMVSTISIVVRMLPSTHEILQLEASKITLSNLVERLAAEVSLIDLIRDEPLGDDFNTIDMISSHVPEIDSLSDADQATVKRCMDTAAVFKDSRETNVRVKRLVVSHDVELKLQSAAKRIADTCGYIFAGRDFTVKLYLRAQKRVAERDVELLVSFAKYPADIAREGAYGSSWVKARGNPSHAWKCLESGKSSSATKAGLGAYYSSVLTICLPGRIGVLAITSSSEHAFDVNADRWAVGFLSNATRALVREALK